MDTPNSLHSGLYYGISGQPWGTTGSPEMDVSPRQSSALSKLDRLPSSLISLDRTVPEADSISKLPSCRETAGPHNLHQPRVGISQGQCSFCKNGRRGGWGGWPKVHSTPSPGLLSMPCSFSQKRTSSFSC